MKELKLLSKGIFEKPFMDSRIKTKAMTRKELTLGHLIGPLGMIIQYRKEAARNQRCAACASKAGGAGRRRRMDGNGRIS